MNWFMEFDVISEGKDTKQLTQCRNFSRSTMDFNNLLKQSHYNFLDMIKAQKHNKKYYIFGYGL